MTTGADEPIVTLPTLTVLVFLLLIIFSPNLARLRRASVRQVLYKLFRFLRVGGLKILAGAIFLSANFQRGYLNLLDQLPRLCISQI